ncbi:D-hexose-6-phosphate mutarotase [Shewanella youngdeokensis]|uniref:Putative glucose-6-phosphate 1-epimerase n=1 Tax=Shewanella youngdeokensis TaxID=2999068 RepID=A0ABZ0K231_9GAMM|nr:D-hexose-6-phosphate mutarotase [Shewanella sp. DAU334]
MGSVTTKQHPNGLDYIDVDTPLCKARIFLQGAQIDTFIPVGKKPLLWVSDANDYQVGTSIRGGIPVCWPWFGQSSTADFPQHGFARTRVWTLESVNMFDDTVEIKLTLPITTSDKHFWPHNTKVEMLFRLSETLSVSITNTNQGDYTVSLTQALHSYFPVNDIHQLTASGFHGANYIEFAEGPFEQLSNNVNFTCETDRVYTQLKQTQMLETTDGIIEVSRDNSHSAVLWNPWIDKSKRLSRFKDDDYLSMVCLEAANVLDDKVTLAPNQSHTLTTHIRWR